MLTKEEANEDNRLFNAHEQKTKTYCLHKEQTGNKWRISFSRGIERFEGRHREDFSCRARRDYHCYYHCLVGYDVVRVQRRQQEVENRLNHHRSYYWADY